MSETEFEKPKRGGTEIGQNRTVDARGSESSRIESNRVESAQGMVVMVVTMTMTMTMMVMVMVMVMGMLVTASNHGEKK